MPSGSAIQKVSETFMPASANSVRIQFGGLFLVARGAAAARTSLSGQAAGPDGPSVVARAAPAVEPGE